MPHLEFKAVGLTPDQFIALTQCFAQLLNGVPQAQPQPQAPAADPFTAPQPQQPAAPQFQAPQPPVQPPVSNGVAPGAVRDVFGVPYNPAIHSVTSGPTGGRNQNGSWKMKKNTSREAYDAWNLQHRTAANAPAPQPQAQPSPAQLNAQFGAPPVNQDPFTSAAPGVAFGAQPQPAPDVTYETFVAKCNVLLHHGRLTAEDVKSVKNAVGCQDETQIQQDPAIRARAYLELLKIESEILQPA